MGPPMESYWDKAKARWDERARRNAIGYTSAADSKEEHEERGKQDAEILLELLARAGARWGRAFEVGCGEGRILKRMAPRFKEVHAGDISAEMIEQARREVPGAAFHVLQGEDLPVGDLEVVYSYGVFQHVPRAVFRRYIETVHRSLVPGGLFLFHLKRPYTLRRKLKALLGLESSVDETWNIRYYTWGALRKFAAARGFQVVQERTDPLDLFAVWRK